MNFPIDRVREQFAALSSPAMFVDNPAGTQVPRRVVEAVAAAMTGAASNLGGFFEASRTASAICSRAHEAMAAFLGAASAGEITIGQCMTMLTYQMARSLGRRWGEGDEIIVTRMDHEGNVSPWLHMAEERGLTVRWLPFNRETWRIEPDELRALLSDRTRLLALNYASNLTGSINPVAELVRIARSAGALVYVDAVQFVPHGFADVQALGCDFLACSSYKFFGPHLGVLWGREAVLAELFAYAPRCATKELPGRHEIGTPQTELIAGLGATVDYFVWLGEQLGASGSRGNKIREAYRASCRYEQPLTLRLIEALREIPGVSIQGITAPERMAERVPTVSFVHARHKSSGIARALGEVGINVWSGHNYAYEVARYLGLDEQEGVLRIGLAHYNTAAEVERLVSALRTILT